MWLPIRLNRRRRQCAIGVLVANGSGCSVQLLAYAVGNRPPLVDCEGFVLGLPAAREPGQTFHAVIALN